MVRRLAIPDYKPHPQVDLVLARLLFFVNVPAILRDISDKLSILKKHLNAHSGLPAI